MELLYIGLLLLVSFVYGAPTALDNQTLLQNAQSAQALNAEFASLSRTDSCTSGQLACIKGSVAECRGATWRLERCSEDEKCFALPSVRTNGTFITCTSEASALSIIKACGGIGGLAPLTVPFPTVNDTSTVATPECSSSTLTTDTSFTTLSGSLATLGQGQSVAIPPTTETLKPDQASSLLSSLLANGGSTTMPTPLTGPVRGASSGTVIKLTAMPSATEMTNM